MKPTRLALKLAARIKEVTDIEVEPVIHRTRAGRNQRASGAWSWWMDCSVTSRCIGSQWSATECLKAPRLDWAACPNSPNDIVLYPEETE